MVMEFIRQVISFGINEKMSELLANRIRRINLFNLILAVMVLLSLILAIVSGNTPRIIVDGFFLFFQFLIFFIIPPFRKPESNSLIILILTALLFLTAYLFSIGLDTNIILAFYLMFPIATVSIKTKRGTLVLVLLGIATIFINFFPLSDKGISLDPFSFVLFILVYTLVIIISIMTEKNNREVLNRLKSTNSYYENELEQRDKFISKLSHKLRTSLSNITLINNLVHDSRLSSEQKDLLDTLKASTNNLIEDVNNIVEIATPGLAEFKQSISSFRLEKVINDVVKILQTDKMFCHEVSTDINNLKSQIIGDPSLLRTIIIYLLKGLGPYKDDKSPFHLEVAKHFEDSNRIRFEFLIEIRTLQASELFNCIQKLNKGEDHKASNIANAYHLIAQTDNQLQIDYSGEKARLFFHQLFTKDLSRTTVEEPPPDLQPDEAASLKVELKNAMVLLVEDNEINQKIVLLSLNKLVNQIDVAKNGKEALDMFGMKQYDIILMDIQMPLMDGLVATKKIREIESTTNKRVPIIAITAYALTGDRDNCLAAGVDDYISKPFQVDVLVKKMNNLLA